MDIKPLVEVVAILVEAAPIFSAVIFTFPARYELSALPLTPVTVPAVKLLRFVLSSFDIKPLEVVVASAVEFFCAPVSIPSSFVLSAALNKPSLVVVATFIAPLVPVAIVIVDVVPFPFVIVIVPPLIVKSVIAFASSVCNPTTFDICVSGCTTYSTFNVSLAVNAPVIVSI